MHRAWRAMSAFLCAASATGASAQLAITGVSVIDGTGAPPRVATVIVEGSRITAIDRRPAIPPGTRIVDGRGKFLVPGFWDMHVHLLHADSGALDLFLANGVTGVREMGGDVQRTAAWRAAIESGRLVGPRLFFAGPILEEGDYFDRLRRMESDSASPFIAEMRRTRIAVPRPEDARAAVDSIRRTGAQVVKVRTASNRATFEAILDAAKSAGLPVAAHAPPGATPAELASAGVASIEHGFFPPLFDYLPHERRQFFRTMAERGMRLTPTLVSLRWSRIVPDRVSLRVIGDTSNRADRRRRYVNEALLANWRRFFSMKRFESPMDWPFVYRAGVRDVSDAQAAGVSLLAGTDFGSAMIFPGFSLHEELWLLVRDAGVPPMDVLIASTRNATRLLGVSDSVGTIEVGQAADLVLLDGNPLADIRHTSRIAAVVARGRLFDHAGLDSLLARSAHIARRPLPGAPP
jgi:imidazolonepropionase-like amidohydrolase